MPILEYLFFSKKNDFIDEVKGSKIVTFRQDSVKTNLRTVIQGLSNTESEKKSNKKK